MKQKTGSIPRDDLKGLVCPLFAEEGGCLDPLAAGRRKALVKASVKQILFFCKKMVSGRKGVR